MKKIKILIFLTIILSYLLITTCTTDSSITGNSDKAIAKPTDIFDINSQNTGDDDEPWWKYDDEANRREEESLCWIEKIIIPSISLNISKPDSGSVGLISSSYDFRDNYLEKSNKGKIFRSAYYELSKYGIENNLVNKYHNEHFALLKSSVQIASELQYGKSNDSILIKKDIAEKLEDMLKIYRNHENHREIDPVLDYLEIELNKYQNKPKSEISASFN